MKAVIDTNVFVSSFFGGKPKQIINLWKNGTITLCLSREIFDEYIQVLYRLGLKEEKELDELAALFKDKFNILFVHNTPDIKTVKKDPGDDKFIECAIALKAEFVISGDKALLEVKNYMGIHIVSPAEFLSRQEIIKGELF